MIEGVRVFPLARHHDERGWFSEIRRESWFRDAGLSPSVQTNVVWSRRGVVRGLHYHLAGQDDVFSCITGTARVVLLDRRAGSSTEGTAWSCDIGDDNPVAVAIPGTVAHGYEAITDCLFCYQVTREYDRVAPDEHDLRWDDPRVRHLWATATPILSERDA